MQVTVQCISVVWCECTSLEPWSCILLPTPGGLTAVLQSPPQQREAALRGSGLLKIKGNFNGIFPKINSYKRTVSVINRALIKATAELTAAQSQDLT